jgi:hypothetical protein
MLLRFNLDLKAQPALCARIQIASDRESVVDLESPDRLGRERTECAVYRSAIVTQSLQPSLSCNHDTTRIGNTAVGNRASHYAGRNNDWRDPNNHSWTIPWPIISRAPVRSSPVTPAVPITAAAAPFHTHSHPTGTHTYSPSGIGKSCHRYQGSTGDRKKFHAHNLGLLKAFHSFCKPNSPCSLTQH